MGSKLKIKKPTIEYGTLLYDGSTYVNAGVRDGSINGKMDLEFKLWLDKDSGYHNQLLNFDGAIGLSFFRAILQDSSIYISQYDSYKHISISGLDNLILNCRFRKFEDLFTLPEFYINNVQQTIQTTSTISCAGTYNGLLIGIGCFRTSPDSGSDLSFLKDAAIWDVKITEVSTGDVMHYWKGYPNGNLDSAWEDIAGNSTVQIAYMNTPSLRNIEGTDSTILLNSNNLRIKQNTGGNVFDFDGGPDYIQIINDVSAHLKYDKKITFNLWLDQSSGYSNNHIMHFGISTPPADNLNIRLDGSLFLMGAFGAEGKKFAIGNFSNQILSCEVNKSSSGIESFKINDQEQTSLGSSSLTHMSGGWYFGYNNVQYLDKATVWNIKIYDTSSAGELIHWWKGYPDASQNSAWVDLIGDSNGTVMNSPSASTRTILGAYALTSNKLKFSPVTTYSGVLDFDGDDVILHFPVTDNSVYEILKGDKKIEFSMWMDTSSFTPTFSFGQGVIDFAAQDASDYLAVVLENDLFKLYTCATGFDPGAPQISQEFSLDNSYIGKILNFEIIKTVGLDTGDGSILSVKVNGTVINTTNRQNLGRGSAAARIGAFSEYLRGATVWNVKITDTNTGILEHYWKGYPDGSSNTAWVDLGEGEKTFDLTFPSGITRTTRNITGFSSSGTLTNKLKLTGRISYYGLLDFNHESYIILSSVPNIDGELNIKFKTYWDSSVYIDGYNDGQMFFKWARNNLNNYGFYIFPSNNLLRLSYCEYNGSPANAKGVSYDFNISDITNAYDNILQFEIDSSKYELNSLRVNGNILTVDSSTDFTTTYIYVRGEIGRAPLANNTITYAKIWDFEYYRNGIMENKWLGYPNGGNNSGWVDQIGSIDGSVVGPGKEVNIIS